MSKPTNLARWGATSPIVEPSNGVKDAGWAVNQRPPAQWLNWWMNAVYLWMIWLDAFESTAHTWTALQTFAAGLRVSAGTTTIDGLAVFNANSTFHGTTTIDALVAGATVFEGDVSIDGYDFNAGSGTATFGGAVVLATTLGVAGATTLAATTVTGDLTATTGNTSLKSPVTLTGSQGPTAINQLYPLGLLRCWVSMKFNGTSAPDLEDALNEDSVGQTSDGEITITFSNAMGNNAYGVIVSFEAGTVLMNARSFTKASGSLKFFVVDPSNVHLTRAALNAAPFNVSQVHVFVFGRQ